jgi:hypothetical protein
MYHSEKLNDLVIHYDNNPSWAETACLEIVCGMREEHARVHENSDDNVYWNLNIRFLYPSVIISSYDPRSALHTANKQFVKHTSTIISSTTAS